MSEKKRNMIGIVFFCLFTLMFVIGCTTPEVAVVFKKATNICLECIGIGG